MPSLMHPVTGAGIAVSDEDAQRYLDDGWVDTTPYDFKDNSWEAVRKSNEEAAGVEQSQESATTAADPSAAGVRGDGGPS